MRFRGCGKFPPSELCDINIGGDLRDVLTNFGDFWKKKEIIQIIYRVIRKHNDY